MSKLPIQKPGKSRQDYSTPRAFLLAVERRFGLIRTDLAASAENSVCDTYFDKERDSLQQDWSILRGVAWCNPPYADIAPWAAKAASVRDRRGWTLLLTPASVGSNWFAEHVHGKASVLFLSPRLCFDGKNSYPKDIALLCYGWNVSGYEPWRWS